MQVRWARSRSEEGGWKKKPDGLGQIRVEKHTRKKKKLRFDVQSCMGLIPMYTLVVQDAVDKMEATSRRGVCDTK